MKDYKIVKPLHKTLSNQVSLTCSKDLRTILNWSGLAFSYAKDLKDSQISRHLWNTVGVKTALQSIPSNMHWVESDNLETMLKSSPIHRAERLTHFLTAQLDFADGLWSGLDLFKKPFNHNIER